MRGWKPLLLNIEVSVAVHVSTTVTIQSDSKMANYLQFPFTENANSAQGQNSCKTNSSQHLKKKSIHLSLDRDHQSGKLHLATSRKTKSRPTDFKRSASQAKLNCNLMPILFAGNIFIIILSLCCVVNTSRTVNALKAFEVTVPSDLNHSTLEFVIAKTGNDYLPQAFQNASSEFIINVCKRLCATEAHSYIDGSGITCNKGDISKKCYQQRCNAGCKKWWPALQEFEPCTEACSTSSFFPYDVPCIASCELGQHLYWQSQRVLLSKYSKTVKPILTVKTIPHYYDNIQQEQQNYETPDNAENSSENTLRLSWQIELPELFFSSRPFNIQYKFVSQLFDYEFKNDSVNSTSDSNEWHNLLNYNCNRHFDCEISEDLMAYTTYKFRFVVPFGEDVTDVLHSPASDPFTTGPMGVPTSKPSIDSSFAMDHNHLVVFWHPGHFINGPLKYFNLIVEQQVLNYTYVKLVPPSMRQYIVDDLLPQTNYTIRLAMVNEEGEGPYATATVMTKPLNLPIDTLEFLQGALLVSEHQIQLQDLQRPSEMRVLYRSHIGIADVALNPFLLHVYVVDKDSNVFTFPVNNSTDIALLLPKEDGIGLTLRIMKLTVDWLSDRLYLAGMDSVNQWAIVSTDIECTTWEELVTNRTESVEQLVVDPNNGWLFWSTPKELNRLDLTSKSVKNILHRTVLNEIGYFVNDFQRFLLLMHNRTNGEIYECSYDGLHIRRLFVARAPLHLSDTHIRSFIYQNGIMVSTNGSHVLYKNHYSKESDTWPIAEMADCRHFWLKHSKFGWKPQQIYNSIKNSIPRKLQALVTSQTARLSWLSPAKNQYQTENMWQQWEYELEIIDVASNNAFTIGNIKTTSFNVEKLQPNNLYSLRVRAMNPRVINMEVLDGREPVNDSALQHTITDDDSIITGWSEVVLARTWPLGMHKFWWIGRESINTSSSILYETNEIGAQAERIANIPHNVLDFVQLNGSLYYTGYHSTASVELHCLNILHPELDCIFTAPNSIAIAHDWRGGKLYWVDKLKNCVVRSSLIPDHENGGPEYEMLPIFGARQLEIDSENGFLYYSTGKRIMRRSLNGMPTIDEIEYFHANDGYIHGFAIAYKQQQLFWIVRQHDGIVRLFKMYLNKPLVNQSDEELLENKFLDRDVQTDTLIYLPEIESLLWIEYESNRAVFLHSDNLQDMAEIELPNLSIVTVVHFKSDYTMQRDWRVDPGEVNSTSIIIEDSGYWDDFSVRWNPSLAAENYTVLYKVLLEYKNGDESRIYTNETREPVIHIREFHRPAIFFNISITPHTPWQAGRCTTVQLRTPDAAPTRPKHMRIFVENIDEPLQIRPNVSVVIRWDPPENISIGTEISYKIYCWFNDELCAEHSHNSVDKGKSLETRLTQLSTGETYTFQVQAFVAGRLKGGEKTAFHALHIDQEAKTLPQLLYATSEHIAELDMDMESHDILVHTSSQVEHLAVIRAEERVLWVNENVELMSCVAGKMPVKLVRMRAEVLTLTVDWISRIVYWAETDANDTVAIYQFDLCHFEGRIMSGHKLFNVASRHLIRNMLILPFSQRLVWLEQTPESLKPILAGRYLNGSGENFEIKIDGLQHMFEGMSSDELETVNLIIESNKICNFDMRQKNCIGSKVYIGSIANGMRQIQRDSAYFYILHNETIQAFNRRSLNVEYLLNATLIRQIRSYNQQSYPKRECLLPTDNIELQPRLLVQAERSLTLELPALNNEPDCELPLPGVKYTLTFLFGLNQTRTVVSFRKEVNITDLEPYTNYSIELSATVFYAQKLQMPILTSKPIIFCTSMGIPSLPTKIIAMPLSPTEIYVNWTVSESPNCDHVFYQIVWRQGNDHSEEAVYNKVMEDHHYTLANLNPGQNYTIKLKVLCNESKFNISNSILVQTFDKPHELQLLESTANNLTLSWLPRSNLERVILLYRLLPDEENAVLSLDITIETKATNTIIFVPNLTAKTKYRFVFKLFYRNVERPYYWPESVAEHFVFETLGDRPGRPGRPRMEMITDDTLKVLWEPAESNGATIVEYSLEALQSHITKRLRRHIPPTQLEGIDVVDTNNVQYNLLNQLPWVEEPQPLADKWIEYCTTDTELSCIVRNIHALRLLMFRVRARNSPYGWGPYSEESERFLEPYVTPEKRESLIFAIIGPACIVSSCVFLLMIIRFIHKHRTRSKKLREGRPSIWSNLSTAQQQHLMLERQRAFSVTSNTTIYGLGPLSDADIALLPHVNSEQITVLNSLGSGSFGEVYQGLIKHSDQDVELVAVKSLRKGAAEFTDFLKEAQLMNNFHHENIIRLIGICFDTDCLSIIMEHTEGGDLLTFLRESNSNANGSHCSLQTEDLLAMCMDVAAGCSYLEDRHFVHCDLACRNCLVSCNDETKRTVKIGDFGSSRDIYKSDHYWKEGMLPVRWMSPECIIDGVFTTQSDVWAYGVLCWEVFTLGQQPYPTRNNLEVLTFVKEGGRLERPDLCPDTLFQLLLECWHESPKERPSFHKSKSILFNLQTDCAVDSDNIPSGKSRYQRGIITGNFTLESPPNFDKVHNELEFEIPNRNMDNNTGNSLNRSSVKVHFENPTINRKTDFQIENIKRMTTPQKDKLTDQYVREETSRL